MAISVEELTRTREFVAAMLDELDLEAYVFEVEPGEQHWVVQIECATGPGWQSVSLPIDRERLQRCAQDERSHRQLLSDWGGRLAACRRR